ncbi:hypothetical protein A2U01_0104080, partial [Trifolium medium]|nr:hypothetical protein [Trifolium medium]
QSVPKLIDEECNLMKPKVYNSSVTTTDNLLDEYLGAIYRWSQSCDEAGTSSGAAENIRSVRPRLF